MKSFLRVLSLLFLAAALSGAQVVRTWTSPNLVGVPSSGTGGLPGGAGNPYNLADLTTNVPDGMVIGHAAINVSLVHGRVGDLTMTLSHCGTSVILFSGSANQLASVNGYYAFFDYSVNTFANAVSQAQGLVPPGTYQPAQPLSAFIGKNAAGPWVLTVADLASGVSGTAGFMEVTVDNGGNFSYPIVPAVTIPDGSGGVCGQPVTQVVNVPSSGQVGMVSLALDLSHTYISDLLITLSHAGVTATIMSPDWPTSWADLFGIYTFEDWAPTAFAQAATVLPGTATLPTGHYRPRSPLSAFQGLDRAGPWFVTICDQAPQDVGTLGGVYLTIAEGSWDLQITQPNGPASVTVTNSGGVMGYGYANMMTLAPGAFPFGWLHGIDISLLDIGTQVALGPPFFGALSSCGSASTTIPGPIPSGLTVYVAGLEIDPSGSIAAFKPAFAYTTP